MTIHAPLLFLAGCLSLANAALAAPLVLWEAEPAQDALNEGFPVGNGRLGALVSGAIEYERIPLNEDSVWSGWVNREADNPAAAEALPAIRQKLLAGDIAAIQEPVAQTQLARERDGDGNHVGQAYGTYQMLAFLDLEFETPVGERTDYRRSLDLDTAIASVSYRIGGHSYTREMFSSFPDQVIALRLWTDAPEGLRFKARLARPDTDASSAADGPGELLLQGCMRRPDGTPELGYGARLRVFAPGGQMTSSEAQIEVSGAPEALLLIAGDTSYRGLDAWPDYHGVDFVATTREQIATAAQRDWETLRQRHVADHQALFRRVAFDLSGNEAESPASTRQRLQSVQAGTANPGLISLYFQYGRYLLIASSRPGALPANLQGIWAVASRDPASGKFNYGTPWNGDYHTNINIQMNYWPAEVANLAETALPLADLIAAMRGPGAQTAAIQHGAEGWTVHTVHNIWGHTAPGWQASWGHFPMAGPWMARHLWEHFAFTQDKAFLAKHWETLSGAARFALTWLIEDEKGRLLSAPAASPENRFRLPSGAIAYFTIGPAMDEMIAWDAFSNLLAAAAVLGKESDPLVLAAAAAKAKLPAPAVGPDGRLLEWDASYEEPEPGHRHVSHLYGLHPGRQITPDATPRLAAAARASLERRLAHGGGHTGWSRAWIVNFWARLGDGAAAAEHLNALLAKSTLPNLFDTHPPFQIDGNFGATAGIAELLLQSHRATAKGETIIELLPALPPSWRDGSMTGLRARGGFEIDLRWENGALTEARITSLAGQPARIVHRDHERTVSLAAGESIALRGPELAEP